LHTPALVALVVPEFELPGIPIRVSGWLAEPGTRVLKGDAVVELLAGDVSITLSAPSDGILADSCVEVDELVDTGQCLATIRNDI
jgi:pyruvate/2-oxoglutarate dehydrogenase complex dihydrolipoamide acyltransferase (E2) component